MTTRFTFIIRSTLTTVFLLFFFIQSNVIVYAQPVLPHPPTSGWVVDDAGMLTDADVANLNNAMNSLSVNNGTDVFMFVTQDCGVDPAQYIDQIFLHWQVGVEQNGMLLVRCDADFYMKSNPQLGMLITQDIESDGFYGYLKPKLDEGNFAGGVIDMLNFFADEISNQPNRESQTSPGVVMHDAPETNIATEAHPHENLDQSQMPLDEQNSPGANQNDQGGGWRRFFLFLAFIFFVCFGLVMAVYAYKNRNAVDSDSDSSDERENYDYPSDDSHRVHDAYSLTSPPAIYQVFERGMPSKPGTVPDDIFPSAVHHKPEDSDHDSYSGGQTSVLLENRSLQAPYHEDLTPHSDEGDSVLSDAGERRPGFSDTRRKKGDDPFQPFE